jgi:glycosyltransferase involved in cell wall biosynthesis
MKILMVNYEYAPLGGGGGVFCSQLAEELVQEHEVTVLTSRFKDQKANEVVRNVTVWRVPVMMRNDPNAASLVSMLSFLPSSLWKGIRNLNLSSFDLVHSHFAIPSAPTGLFLAKAFNKPHVLSILGGDVYDPSKKLSPHDTPVLHAVVQSMINRSDRVVALSNDIRKRAIHHYQPKKSIDIVWLGIPKPDFVQGSREVHGFSREDILLVTVGRLVARKGVGELVDLIESIPNPRLKLIVIGDGPERKPLEARVDRLGLQERVRFGGFVSDEEKFQLLSISDCYVSTSLHEGFGIVFLEAMACGLPVVCYDRGGQVEFLTNGRTGFLIGLGRLTDFKTQLMQLVNNTSLRRKIGQHNRSYALENYLISTSAQNYAVIYDQVMAANRGSS